MAPVLTKSVIPTVHALTTYLAMNVIALILDTTANDVKRKVSCVYQPDDNSIPINSLFVFNKYYIRQYIKKYT